MCAREEHPLKAERMVSKSLGSDTSVSFSQSEAKSAGRILVPVESLMETRLGQCVNVEPLKKGPPFTSTRSSFSQERKAPFLFDFSKIKNNFSFGIQQFGGIFLKRNEYTAIFDS